MRAPAFWWQERANVAALALSPAGWIMGALAARRMARDGADAGLPVICAGNFVAGGAGKTPVALACAQMLQRTGHKPVFLSRGYGGSASRSGTPLLVDLPRHDAGLTGDEPQLLALCAPAIVAADRIAGAHAAAATGADVIIMDDGLQNPSLRKDFRIAVVDGGTGIGNALCIPAGPLRAPFEQQLNHVDALVTIGQGEAGVRVEGRARARGIATFRAELQALPSALPLFAGTRVVAFAGIGRPDKFFHSLEAAGAVIADAYSFDDHQMLNASDLTQLRTRARSLDAQLATTEKDIVRLRAQHDVSDMLVLPVRLAIAGEQAFLAAMLQAANLRKPAH